ncbi:MAG: 6-bladed beta-propeller [Candidatus Krumholzibacteriota bacterium]|nr:6-bladed beta-propeller [Candidatus Krumholzibacteriota bacterium]
MKTSRYSRLLSFRAALPPGLPALSFLAGLPVPIFLAALLGLVIIAGCGEKSPLEPAEGPIPARIAPRVKVIPENDSLSLNGFDGSFLMMNDPHQSSAIGEGDLVVGTGGGGYIRKVISASRQGPLLCLETVPGYLTDAVESGRIDTVLEIGLASTGAAEYAVGGRAGEIASAVRTDALYRPDRLWTAPGVSLAGGRLDLSGFIIYRNEIPVSPAEISVSEGYVDFTPVLESGFTIISYFIHEVHAIAEGTLDLNFAVRSDLPEETDIAGELPVASVEKTIIQYIGRVPVVEKATLSFILKYQVEGVFSGDCRSAISHSTDYRIGSRYYYGAWSDERTALSSYHSHSFECEDYASCRMEIRVIPRLDISFYSVPAFRIEIQPYLGYQAETQTPPFWAWELSGGTLADCIFDPGIIGSQPGGRAASLVENRLLLEAGPYATDHYIFVLAWGSVGYGDYNFEYPRGIALDGDENVYVTDNWNHRVQIFDADSTFITAWGTKGSGPGQFQFPADIASDAAGNIYVVDNGNHRIQKFLPDGTLLLSWGSKGGGAGQFESPEGIALNQAGEILVTDSYLHRVQKFAPDSTFIDSWGSLGTGPGQFNSPMGIVVDPAGYIYISECYNHRVQKFSPEGDCQFEWGGSGTGPGKFNCPFDLAIDPDNNIVVTDYGNHRVQVFDSAGDFIATLGSPGISEGEFVHPVGLVSSPSGNLYVVDSGNRRVQKFKKKPQ